MGKVNQSLYSSSTDEWATPRELFRKLNEEFHFTLDPCCSEANYTCPKHYTIFDDGLQQDWSGHTCYVNPPFSQMKAWVRKCYEESTKPNTKVVMLIPSRTDTSYFHDYIYGKAEIRFIRGRLHFNDLKQKAPFPSMLVIFPSNSKNS